MNAFFFSRSRCAAGVLLALASSALCLTLRVSVKAAAVFALLFALAGLAALRKVPPGSAPVFRAGVLLLSGCLTLWLSQRMLGENVAEVGLLRAALGVFCCLAPVLLLYGLTGAYRLSAVLGSLLPMLLTAADHFVLRFRGSELIPTDLFAWRAARNVAGNYRYLPDAPFTYAWILWALCVFLLTGLPRLPVKKRGKTALAGTLGAAVCAAAVFFGGQNVPVIHFEPAAPTNGYLLNFSMRLPGSVVAKPSGYSAEQVRQIAAGYGVSGPDSAERTPDIIVIMNESFADLRVLGGGLKTDVPVTPNLDALTENTVRGFALVSVFGGLTPNSEFEFLTGHSMANLPDGSIPYQQFLRAPTVSMASVLRERGYETAASHPFHASGWNRRTAWELLGFEKTEFLGDYPETELVRGFVSDGDMVDFLLDGLSSADRPQFRFVVSMQNHGPYDTGEIARTVRLDGMTACPEAEEYLSLLRLTDAAAGELLEALRASDRDTVLVFFGDHLPKLPESFYEEIHGGGFDSLNETMLRYEVPFVIWTNYESEASDAGVVSLNFLSSLVYRAAGMKSPAYIRFLGDVRAEIPAMNALGYFSRNAGGFVPYSAAADREAEILAQYRAVQYNGMFDGKNQNGVFFPGE